jgi:hypothetical protein
MMSRWRFAIQAIGKKEMKMKYEINTFRRLALCAAPLILICSAAVAPARAQDAVAAQTQTPTDQQLSEGQIEQLVAPIALYPDPLLSQVLMASTYPLEVIEAARWSQANSTVKGEALQDVMQSQSWDPTLQLPAALRKRSRSNPSTPMSITSRSTIQLWPTGHGNIRPIRRSIGLRPDSSPATWFRLPQASRSVRPSGVSATGGIIT